MPGSSSDVRLDAIDEALSAENTQPRARNAEMAAENAAPRAEQVELRAIIASLTARVSELERALGADPSPLGPEAIARAALLTCGHYSPIGRSRRLLDVLCGIDVSTGFLAGIRGRAARRLDEDLRALPASPAGRRAGAARR